jgi:hypothetical protein
VDSGQSIETAFGFMGSKDPGVECQAYEYTFACLFFLAMVCQIKLMKSLASILKIRWMKDGEYLHVKSQLKNSLR